MNRNFYLKLLPIGLALILLTVTCKNNLLINLPEDDKDDTRDPDLNPPTEILLPVEGNDTYSSGHMFHGDYVPAWPTDGYARIANAVKYPESARLEGIEGVVILSFKLLSDGTIQEITSLDNNVDLRLLSASIDAVLSIKWSPAIHKGVPADSYITVPVRFNLGK